MCVFGVKSLIISANVLSISKKKGETFVSPS